jgi:hypothetical protein
MAPGSKRVWFVGGLIGLLHWHGCTIWLFAGMAGCLNCLVYCLLSDRSVIDASSQSSLKSLQRSMHHPTSPSTIQTTNQHKKRRTHKALYTKRILIKRMSQCFRATGVDIRLEPIICICACELFAQNEATKHEQGTLRLHFTRDLSRVNLSQQSLANEGHF